jgi:anti-sigma28 factor (negative regulator of flagellin synthesis)
MEKIIMALIDINAIEAEAKKEINEERSKKAKTALVTALRKKEAAMQVVRNIDAEIEDLKASIADGSFTS